MRNYYTWLVNWLQSNHMPYLSTTHAKGTKFLPVAQYLCGRHHELAAYAIFYHVHTVLYCYHP